MFYSQESYIKALEYYSKARAIFEKSFGPNHLYTKQVIEKEQESKQKLAENESLQK